VATVKQLLKLLIILPFIILQMTAYAFAEKIPVVYYEEPNIKTSAKEIEKNIPEEKSDFPESLYFIGFIPVIFVSILLILLIKTKNKIN
jgi:Na+/H+ antiporter NhaC